MGAQLAYCSYLEDNPDEDEDGNHKKTHKQHKSTIMISYARYKELQQVEASRNEMKEEYEAKLQALKSQLQLESVDTNMDNAILSDQISPNYLEIYSPNSSGNVTPAPTTPIHLTLGDLDELSGNETELSPSPFPPNKLKLDGDYGAFSINENHPKNFTPKQGKIDHMNTKKFNYGVNQIEVDINFDGKCQSISTCIAIKRIARILGYYALCGDNFSDMNKMIMNHNYNKHLLNDYHHILHHHLENKDTKQIGIEFDLIYNEIIHKNKVGACDIKSCEGFYRNHGSTEKKMIEVEDEETQFYIEIMDSIHCYFMHSYDIAMRNEMDLDEEDIKDDKTLEDDPNDDEDDITQSPIIVDEKILKLKRKLKQKWDNLNNIISKNVQNKFYSDTQKIKKMEEQEQYSFGFRYYYWKKFRDNDEMDTGPNRGYKKGDWYIHRKFTSLKAELLGNNTKKGGITVHSYNTLRKKAKKYTNSQYAKSTISDACKLQEYCQIKPGIAITVQHVFAIILYCDCTDLSFKLGTTFRFIDDHETIKHMKKRNAQYWNWCKLLRETVELWGTSLGESTINIFYHGVSYMTFSHFLAYFSAPTSTTIMQNVAQTFASENGMSSHSSFFFCFCLKSIGCLCTLF